jgi:alpha-tubulin suppressor-like RCC1 family protein
VATAVAAVVVAALAVTAPPPAGADQNDAPTRTAFRSLSAGNSMSCAITGAGVLKCWGQNNADGALGQGDNNNRGDQAGEMGDSLTPVPLGTGRSAVAVSSANDHSCVLLDNASVKCFGWNGGGQLGVGDGSPRGDGPGELGDALPAVDLGTGRTAVAVSANGSQSCAILDNGQLKCWGDNLFGQLGQGDGTRRGDNPGELGDALLPVDLGTGRTATAVATGRSHTCAILDNGSVKCWGWNQFGQLGLGDTNNSGGAAGQMGDALPAVDLGTGRTAVALSAGFLTTCALLDNGRVKCWGNNGSGQLGLGDTNARGDGPGEMGDALPAVDLGTGRTAVAISVADTGPCALLDNGRVKCWGLNISGLLGQGDTENRGDGPGEMGDALPPIDLGTGRTAVAITGGNVHNCARLDDDSVKCWGDNNAGALGLGDTSARGDGPGEMGDALPAVQLVTPAPGLSVGVSGAPLSVPAGQSIGYDVTVTNTGNVGLTGVTVSTPGSGGCAAVDAVLVPGASDVVACSHVATVDDIPTYATSATADSDQTAPVSSSTVDVAVTIPAGQAVLKGTVTVGVFGNPVPGALVAALAPADYSVAGLDLTAADGTFAMLVPAGSYFVYVADPSGGHIAAFVPGPPTALGDGATVVVDPEVARSTGSIGGRITDATSGDGIPRGLALSVNAETGQIGRGAPTLDDGSGSFAIPSLPLVSQYVVMVDLAGAHRPTFFGGTPSPAGATPVTVPAGAQQNIGETPLEAQPAPGGAAAVQGTVTGPGGAPLEGVAVLALSASTFGFAGGDVTDAAGRYEVPVDAGDYLVGFADTAGTHTFEWHANRSSSELGSADPVTAGVGSPAVVDAELAGANGSIAGTITEDGSGAPVSDAWVFAIDSSGSVVGVGRTAPDGTYSIAGLPALPVRVRIMDLTGAHVPEYWDDVSGPGAGSDYPSATVVTVAGGATSTVDAALTLSN